MPLWLSLEAPSKTLYFQYVLHRYGFAGIGEDAVLSDFCSEQAKIGTPCTLIEH